MIVNNKNLFITEKLQLRASNPYNSAWVSANAGSGKTYVLAQRVVRLLLRGVEPAKILCLTFTKTAASEMSLRVFQLLSEWALASDKDLSDKLHFIEGKVVDKARCNQARRLFAQALETPGGIKIQTIHAFCEALLHQFPVEANVPANFKGMDEVESAQLLSQAKKQVFIRAADSKNSKLNNALVQLLQLTSESNLMEALDSFIDKRHEFEIWANKAGSYEKAIDEMFLYFSHKRREHKFTGLKNLLDRRILDKKQWSDLAMLAGKSKSKTDQEVSETAQKISDNNDLEYQFERLQEIFLNKDKSFKKKPLTDKFFETNSDWAELLENQKIMLKQALEWCNSWEMVNASKNLFQLGYVVLQEYELIKHMHERMDFDDMIEYSVKLLNDSEASDWIRYKLDYGIDHILVDEAQDISPKQWQIICALTEEFFTSDDDRFFSRSIFAVGDEKQSIYSFQGARPDSFDFYRRVLSSRAEESGKIIDPIKMKLSFRSNCDVLGAVDHVFSNHENFNGLTRENQKTVHYSNRKNDPGFVEIWPLFHPSGRKTESEDWIKPVDQPSDSHPAILLAKRIAQTIHDWISKGKILPAKNRPVRCGDIMILMRKRAIFLNAVVRELTNTGLPIAGADRIDLTQHIVVQDFLALGRFCLLPEDDLSLACALKSPLFEVSEEELFQLAYGREGTLYEKILECGEVNEKFCKIGKQLSNLIEYAQNMRSYDFYATLLSRDGARKRFIKRLGNEADEIIDAFLQEALDYEHHDLCTLELFIDYISAVKLEIKREIDTERDEIRILTVHAAKGLESPIVFLVDPCSENFAGKNLENLVSWPRAGKQKTMIKSLYNQDTGFLWRVNKKFKTPFIEKFDQEQAELKKQEYNRLLYVGMTRAADWLIVCGYRNDKPVKYRNWHQMVLEALDAKAQKVDDKSGNLLKWHWCLNKNKKNNSSCAAIRSDTNQKKVQQFNTKVLPDWIDQQVTTTPEKYLLSFAPSNAGKKNDINQKYSFDTQIPVRKQALEYGKIIHKLLQILPEITLCKRRKHAETLLKKIAFNWSEDKQYQVIDMVDSLLKERKLSDIFESGSQAEVEVYGKISLGLKTKTFHGIIDRLIVKKNSVKFIDYKTDIKVPAEVNQVRQDYLVQMACYWSILKKIYPEKSVDAILVWTHNTTIMPLPDMVLKSVLEQKSY